MVRTTTTGGAGGDGCVSFLREKFLPKGPPNGGNGGRGGHVILRATAEETTLRNVGRQIKGKRGQNGLGSGRHGMAGEDLILEVPIGTIVREREIAAPVRTEEEEDDLFAMPEEDYESTRWVSYPREEIEDRPGRTSFFKQAQRLMAQEDRYLAWRERKQNNGERLLVDLKEPGQEVVLCRGGAGGYGNPFFLTSENRSPKFATRGRPGEKREYELELKTIADMGLVGLPNAGKSTLLGAISNAHPKQADYAFTTLHPFVGTVDFADKYQLTVADIPGLIEGAHRNVGLGHAFLRHVERAKILVYVVDVSGEAPWKDLQVLQNELEAYRPGLTDRPSVVVANKADQVRRAKENLARLQQEFSLPVVPVSARYEKNILKLTSMMRKMVEEAKQQ
ncbi:P-loop containing nucleoside triphosphate hydrolase protein [Syncephalastrum racemosum]|uniref:P-loop containing nucleoside triphosphate hydrolase protein n=1 Tax=Syncephalastrum racemosum TaxID=13706 RepID=A0A1X2H580_SYNRA|nr:P-loop containing nucleoside triphosphate hydrolase protein [Syncephalastrum racemosum]